MGGLKFAFGGRSHGYCTAIFAPMYPTVCTLMQLWPFVIANGIDETECTDEIRELLQRFTLRDLKSRSFWEKSNVLVLVKPGKDVFPVRARYPIRNIASESTRTIGLNLLSGLWYTLADCVASIQHTGRIWD